VTGDVAADEVVVRGRVVGSFRGVRITLQAQCHVEGDIFHQSLAIEQGAYFEGKSRRSDDPLAENSANVATQTAPSDDAGEVGLPSDSSKNSAPDGRSNDERS
jgi:cytoskeletal protein CcmA (bactofilin family)